ncbi:conserved hypothetical protein [Bifidobacterium scardovii JCM 12489 = DSM 13734]|nr:conserved hypothetical protein [Bifidobacterium scardovii JCM 12489 = DSM 13734]
MHMSGHYSLGLLFDVAQQERRCVRPRTDTDIRAVARRVKKNEIVRVYRGLYAVRTYWDQLDQHERTRHIVRSLALWHPQWVFCGPTAAVMHGLECSYRLSLPICIVSRTRSHGRNSAGLAHYVIPHPETSRCGSVPVTSVGRTLVDCAAKLPLRYALGPIDSALRLRRITRDELHMHLAAAPYLTGRHKAEYAFSVADGRSENGGESEGRGVLAELGFPVHDIQVEFPCLSNAYRCHRVDYWWRRADGTVVVGELDGVRKYVDPSMTSGRDIRNVVDDERDRQRCLERQGADVLRFYYSDLNDLGALAYKLRRYRVPERGGA